MSLLPPRKTLWLTLLMGIIIVGGWYALVRYQTHSIDCATGAESCEETHP